ncbi:fimbrillin family protein [Bacteroides sp. NSJ-90]|uniref:fimbrillin family protein n=1 Tax=Bacteroides propionicigenes TaxID=2834112 RepID=UPI001BCC82D5|nr:fimbrillin family protein [Bacteroides propionicigenes]MBS7573885.1 fimbrillin family protein [Bacteroides propionicigenes]
MRRIKGTYILIPLFCTLLCIGCDNEDTTLMPTQPIGFSTSVDDSATRADSDTHAATRAEATTANLTEIGVFAYNTGTSYMASTGFAPNLLCNQSVKKVNGTWTYSPVKYWPANPNDKVSFFAYAPHSASVPSGGDQISAVPTSVTTNGSPAIIYTPVKGELDILYSLGELNCTNNHGTVRFTMKHATTKVIFKVKVEGGGSKTITGVSTECVYATGIKFNGSDTGITVRTLSKNRTTCTATNLNITAGSTATTVKEFFLPPDHMTDTKVSLSYLDGSTTKTIETTLPNANDWILGKAIGYTFTIKDNQIISITVDADMAWDAQEKPKPTPVPNQYDYYISTAEDLAIFRDLVNNGKATDKKAIQIADINLQDLKNTTNYADDATDWTPIGKDRAFTGTYNGNGYTIRNLKITAHNSQGYPTGLFSKSSGTLVGIHLRNVDIDLKRDIESAGALVGQALGGNITACSAIGDMWIIYCDKYNYNTPPSTGGLIGKASNTYISFCRSDITIGEGGILITSNSPTFYSCYVGGFIGDISGCNIASCRSSGDIRLETINAASTHNIRIGGFVASDDGSSFDEILGSYSTGRIYITFTGSSSTADSRELFAGGFIGYAGSSTFKCASCYTYTEINLTHPTLKNGIRMNNFYFSGFAGNALSCTLQNCYGDSRTIPNWNDWGNVFVYNIFAPSGGTRDNCHTYGSTSNVMTIMKTYIQSTNTFKFIKYDPSTNSYFIDDTGKQWLSSTYWADATSADDNKYPRINYSKLNITP